MYVLRTAAAAAAASIYELSKQLMQRAPEDTESAKDTLCVITFSVSSSRNHSG